MTRTCRACGRPVTLINWSKAQGRIGLTVAWVHAGRPPGLFRRRWDHAPVVDE